jgi:transmembrane sensor
MNTPTRFSNVEVAASEWLVTLSDPDASSEDRRRCADWLAADPEHERVFRAQQDAWRMAGDMTHLLERPEARFAPAAREALVVKRSWALAAAAAVVALLGVLSFEHGLGIFGGEQFSTKVAQLEELKLEDGTVISLGAASRIRVAMSDRRREVSLLRGQAFFSVAHDASRPFFVKAGATQVRVVGTKFDVTYGADSVRVSVLEGRVDVVNAASEQPPATQPASSPSVSSTAHALTAGQGVVISDAGRLDRTFPVAPENLAAWRAGRLVYVDARLRDVVADVARYYGGEIRFADPAVGDLQLTAAFRVDQIDRMLEVLARALPIEVRRVDERSILLVSRQQ